jgi:PHD/YefM family antitoxin component YafN of YafNO toxin-antitoxin module
MLNQERFISSSELQQNVSKTIDKVKQDDIIIIRNNRLEAAMISIDKYNQFLEYLEWKKLSDALDALPEEYVTESEAQELTVIHERASNEESYSIEDIERMAKEEKNG